ncbi:MAG: type III glutamate--ammonia ligase [Actinobacteria bacterium]|nr:type III glutamate--ammonia ligase [Actinomycetota bacterium]
MPDDREQLRTQAEKDDIEFFFAMFVDMHGKPCAKLVPADTFDTLTTEGVGFAGFAAGPLGQSPADPDLMAIPDPSSYTPVPWQPGLAVLQSDLYVDGEPWPYAPRWILKWELERLATRGLVLKTGAEAEYFLVRRRPEGGIALADPLDTADKPCYDAKGLSRMYDHLTTVSTYMNTLGWSNYANDHEDANGQFEQNITFADALTTADRVVFFRYMVHTLAHEAGMAATFMPKPFDHLTGSGLHTHTSLWTDDGNPLFHSDDDARQLGLSSDAYHFIGGVLEHAPALTAVMCPTVNSYKRMGVGAPTSGATWAPAYATYGGNNRTVMLRVPEPGRFENRVVDGAANPYLAFAAMSAAGRDGMDRGVDPGDPVTENLYALSLDDVRGRGIAPLPATLDRAVDALVDDAVLRDALGEVPDGHYIDYFADTKRDEFRAYHRTVSGWEVDRYLTLF